MEEIHSSEELEKHLRFLSALAVEASLQEGERRREQLRREAAARWEAWTQERRQVQEYQRNRRREENRQALDREKKLRILAFRWSRVTAALDRWLSSLDDEKLWELLKPRLVQAAPFFQGREPLVRILGLDHGYGQKVEELLGSPLPHIQAESAPVRGFRWEADQGRLVFRATTAELAEELKTRHPQALVQAFFPQENSHG